MVELLTSHPKTPRISLLAGLFLLLWGVCPVSSVPAIAEVEFPGPVVRPILAPPLSATAVPWSSGTSEFLAVGDAYGFLSLVYHLSHNVNFGVFDRLNLDGELLCVEPWPEGPFGGRGLLVATANPDRLHFIELSYSLPHIRPYQSVDLPEDPGAVVSVDPGPLGQPQLAVSLPGVDQILVLRQESDLWSIRQTLPTGDEPHSLAAVDLDDNGTLELVSADRGVLSGTLSFFDHPGDGNYFLTGHESLSGQVFQLQQSDFDLDGVDELMVSYSDLPVLEIFTGNTGDLLLQISLELSFVPDDFQIVALPQGDWGLATCIETRGLVEFLVLNDGLWSHQDTYYSGCQPVAVQPCDLNGDGMQEMTCLGTSSQSVGILLGNSLPGFWGYPATALPSSPGGLVLDDFEGNGTVDLVISGGDPLLLSVYLRDSESGPFGTAHHQELDFFPGAMAAGDFLGSPLNELALVDLFSQNLVLMAWNNENGFEEQSSLALGNSISRMTAADVDGDGFQDLVMPLVSAGKVMILFGRGDGTFDSPLEISLPLGAYDVKAVALNQDTQLDLVVSDGLSRIWSIINETGRTFGTPAGHEANSGARVLNLADLDGDEDLDVVVANFSSESLSFFENLGDGSLERRIGSLQLGEAPRSVECKDLNGDDIPDVVATLASGHGQRVIEADGVWQYFFAQELHSTEDIVLSAVEDLNQDGKADILNLDGGLQLGLVLQNTELTLVSVEPSALSVSCLDGRWSVRIRPDRPGPWSLDLGQDEHWLSLATDGFAHRGSLDFDGRDWILSVGAEELGHPVSGDQLRLTLGVAGEQESLILGLPNDCVPTASNLPRLSWQNQPWPNPFNPRIQGRVRLEQDALVEVSVFDAAGRKITTLVHEELTVGVHEITWDGKKNGRAMAAGLYFLRVRTGESLLSQKILLVK